MKLNTKKVVGIIMIVAGLALLISGIVQFTQFQDSVAGKISGVISDLGGSRSETERAIIMQMIASAIMAVCGIVIVRKS
jgi:uncharacterized membrane protein YdcZ (DUF606 family)